MKIFLYFVGKPRNDNANRMAEEFVKRTRRYARCEMREVRPDRLDLSAKHPSATRILLDPAGDAMDSRRFTGFVDQAEREARDLVFVVGGAEGVPEVWRPAAHLLLSLSPMTFQHELARVMLAEQIYRAFTTLRGHPYAR